MKLKRCLMAMLWPSVQCFAFRLQRYALAALMTTMCLQTQAQAPASGVAAPRASGNTPRQLQVGDIIPEYLWHLPLQVVNHPEGKKTITLNDYRGKLIILDFWATWCKPCIQSLTKLDKLQAQFGDSLAVVATTYEQYDKAGALMAAKAPGLTSVYGDANAAIKAYFPHRMIPHQVWIAADTVYGFTGSSMATEANLAAIIRGDDVRLKLKSDIMDFRYDGPLIEYARSKDVPVFYHQSLTGYVEGLGASISSEASGHYRVFSYYNIRLSRIIGDLLGIPESGVMIEGPDDRSYCFQAVLPADTDREVAGKLLLARLHAALGTVGRIETRTINNELQTLYLISHENPIN